MQEITLDPRIKKAGDLADEGFKELKKYQDGNNLILKTGYEEVDCHIGGMLPGDCLILAGSPSSGKSETLYRMTDNVMNKEINPNAEEFVSLEYSLEMKMLKKLLRATHRITGKRKSDILFEPFNEEEALKVKEYYKNLQDDRRYVVQEPVSPIDFYNMTRNFCLLNRTKKAIWISADHILLFKGKDKQAVLEEVSEYINLLKLEFNNVFFAILSQLNRAYASVVKERSNDMIPNNTHLFGSSFMEQLADYIIIITNPFKQSVREYLRFHEDRYDYLSEFFVAEKQNKISFDTVGNLFLFVSKIRESDSEWKNLFIRKLDLPKEQLDKMRKSENETISFTSTPNFSTTNLPTFDSTKPLPEVDFKDVKSVFD
jgi:replicative DNA helicase